MKVLVTGAAGFIGSHLVNWYVKCGYDVVGIDNYEFSGAFDINTKVDMRMADIRKRDGLKKLIGEIKPDLVNHHAARIDPRMSMQWPVKDTETNYLGTMNVVDAAVEAGCEKIIFASSCAVYGDIGASRSMIEGQFELPNCPYGISKLASEKYLRMMTRIHGTQVVILRYPNVYGSNQRGNRGTGVIAIFAYQMARNKPITIYGDGTAQYQYCHVDDIVRANVAAEKYMADPRKQFLLVNIAGLQLSVNDIAAMLQQHFDGYDICPLFEKPRPGEQYRITMSGESAWRELEWEPQIDVRKGIAHVAEAAKEDFRKEESLVQFAQRSS